MCLWSQVCHQHLWSFCLRRVQGSSPNSTLLLVLNVLLKSSGRYHSEHTLIMYEKMSSKEKSLQYLADKISDLSYFSGMMKTGDKLAVLQILKSRRLPWNSPYKVMHMCSAGQREMPVGGLADKSAGLTQSHKSLNSVPQSTVGISLWCPTLFGGVQPPDALNKAIIFCIFLICTFLSFPGFWKT